MRPFTLSLAALLLAITTTAAADDDDEVSISATPHDSYSSSVGVLGCKINTNRVAYWPLPVSCDSLCVRLSLGARSVHLLRVDQSGGAYDVSYDAWNYLQTGHSAADAPIAGGGVAMTYANASMSECAGLIHSHGGGLPLSAANSMNFLASCLEGGDDDGQGTWVGDNWALYNIADPVCSLGYDEECSLDWAAGENQASCKHTLGSQEELTSEPVYNIRYPTGEKVLAATNEVVSDARALGSGDVSWAVAGLVLTTLFHSGVV